MSAWFLENRVWCCLNSGAVNLFTKLLPDRKSTLMKSFMTLSDKSTDRCPPRIRAKRSSSALFFNQYHWIHPKIPANLMFGLIFAKITKCVFYLVSHFLTILAAITFSLFSSIVIPCIPPPKFNPFIIHNNILSFILLLQCHFFA